VAADPDAASASVRMLVREKAPSTGFFHQLSIDGQSTAETMRSVAQGRLLGTARHTTIFSPYACPCLSPSDRCHFFWHRYRLRRPFVCNYRPSGAEGSGRLLFARRSRATAEDGFSYQGQLRAADLLVSEASFFEPLVHRAVHRAASLTSGHVSLTSNNVRVLGAFLGPKSPVPTVLGLQALLRPLAAAFSPRHLHSLAGGVASMVAAGAVQLAGYVRPHQVPARLLAAIFVGAQIPCFLLCRQDLRDHLRGAGGRARVFARSRMCWCHC
jgi:hypothetical protein